MSWGRLVTQGMEKEQRYVSLTTLVVASMTGLVVFSIVALQLVHLYFFDKRLQGQFEERVLAEAREITLFVQQQVEAAQLALDALSRDNTVLMTLQLGVKQQLRERMAFFRSGNPGAAFFVRPAGEKGFVGVIPTKAGEDVSRILDLPAPHSSSIHRTSDGRFYVAFSRDIRRASQLLGKATVFVFFDTLRTVKGGRQTGRVLFGKNGNFWNVYNGEPYSVSKLSSAGESSLRQCIMSGERGVLADAGYLNMLYAAPLTPLEKARQEVWLTNFFVGSLTILVCLIVAIGVSRKLTSPLRQLILFARRAAEGEKVRSEAYVSSSLHEVQQVTQALDTMLQSLRKAEELKRYQALFDDVVDPVIIFNGQGTMLEGNNRALAKLGYSRKEFLCLSIFDIVILEDHRAVKDEIDLLFAVDLAHRKGGGRKVEVRIVAPDGTAFFAEMHSRKIQYMDEEVLLSVLRDISTQKKAEKALLTAKKQAEDANQAKSGFLAAMSHEIRTPMHSVLGMTDMLEETSLTAKQQKYVSTIRSSGEILLELINDILDFSKIEAGYVQLETISFSLEQLIERAHSVVAVRAVKQGVIPIAYIAPDVPDVLRGDPAKLQQILVNLLSNAVKFTPVGTVLTLVRLREISQEGVVLEIAVRDTGIGIPPEKHAAIFEMFTQADSSTSREYGGTGLGLTITKRLVEYLDGDISVDSREGRGATFTVTAKFALPSDMGRGHSLERRPVLDGLDVLVLENCTLSAHYLDQILTDFGAICTQVFSVEDAIVRMQQKSYSLMLVATDVYREAELENISRLKELGAGGMPPVIAIAPLPEQERDDEAGVFAVLARPVLPDALLKGVVSAQYGERKKSGNLAAEHGNGEVQGGRILVVEDSDANRMLLGFFFKDTPFIPEFASNGKDAVELFIQGSYNAVLMDIQMPGMDGYEATRAIREYEAENGRKAVPIIALTANAYEDDKENCLQAGCTDYLPKPAKKSVVLATLSRHISTA